MNKTIQETLRVTKEDAINKIIEQINQGREITASWNYNSKDHLRQFIVECDNWLLLNEQILVTLFKTSSVANDYKKYTFKPQRFGYSIWGLRSLRIQSIIRCGIIDRKIHYLNSICKQVGMDDVPLEILPNHSNKIRTNVFIGHGRSQDWRQLKDLIEERLRLPWVEFNRVPVSGISNIARLTEMLDQSNIAFLVMTAEDEQTDGTLHARENVIHEAGLFQSRLGFERAILLLEDGCKEFSNIHGIGQIRFPKGNIKASFEDIREVLIREGILT